VPKNWPVLANNHDTVTSNHHPTNITEQEYEIKSGGSFWFPL
jgi:hypothetical protein